jgi:diadenosine tetraphosphate (Ap4A) HIT family hydrolase
LNIETCFICRKPHGQEAAPPDGYIYEDENWKVCHAPGKLGPLGTLFIESKRHFLDFAEFNDEEQASYGILAKRISSALKKFTNAERIYQVSMVEGVPHFHAWLIPRTKDILEHGVAFLARDDSCNEEDAIALVNKLREAMK